MQKVFFRADAGKNIGYGHFVRSLALADMLKENFECVFFTQSPTEYQRNEISKVCRSVGLPNTEKKFDDFLEYLNGDEIVVLDNYFYSTDYQKAIKAKGCRIVCIDDIHDKHYVADIVINHGLSDPDLFDVEPYTKLCLGLEWALLRKPFLTANTVKREKGHWLVSFGGSDYYNLTEKTVKRLRKCPEVKKITAIVGDAFEFEDSLRKYENIEVLKNISADQMSFQLKSAEYAVVPSSGICIEALACGCKVASGYYVENQKDIYAEFLNKSLVFGMGNFLETLDKTDFSSIIEFSPSKVMDTSGIKERFIKLFKLL